MKDLNDFSVYDSRAVLVGILFLTLIAYSHTIGFQFTNWDDDIHVTENMTVQELSARSIADSFLPSTKYMYHPLTMISYMIDWSISHGAPWSFHMTNVALHCANIIILFFVLRRLNLPKTVLNFCLILFALHPLQSESVAWISARKELLYAMFYLLSLLGYLQWKKSLSFVYLFVSFVCFILSLLSKPTAVTLPVVIIAATIVYDRTSIRSTLISLIPFFIVMAGFSLFLIQTNTPQSILPFETYTWTQRIFFIVYGLAFYLWKAAYPVFLSACYGYPPYDIPISYFVMTGVVVISALTILIVSRERRNTIAGLLLYGVLISPVLQIIPFTNASFVADRYAYLPIVGIGLFFGYGVRSIIERIQDQGSIELLLKKFMLLFITVCLFLVSYERTFIWKESVSLFTDVIGKKPDLALAYGNRGNALIAKGDYAGAIADLNQMLLLQPNNGKALYNQGNAYSQLGKYAIAIENYSSAIRNGFTNSAIFYNRGIALYKTGSIDEALMSLHQALAIDSRYVGALYTIGYIQLHDKDDPVAALKFLDSTIHVNPADGNAYYYRAEANLAVYRYGEALSDMISAALLQPAFGQMPLVDKVNVAIQRTMVSIDSLTAMINRNPSDIASRRTRAQYFLRLGDTNRAAIDERKIKNLLAGINDE